MAPSNAGIPRKAYTRNCILKRDATTGLDIFSLALVALPSTYMHMWLQIIAYMKQFKSAMETIIL